MTENQIRLCKQCGEPTVTGPGDSISRCLHPNAILMWGSVSRERDALSAELVRISAILESVMKAIRGEAVSEAELGHDHVYEAYMLREANRAHGRITAELRAKLEDAGCEYTHVVTLKEEIAGLRRECNRYNATLRGFVGDTSLLKDRLAGEKAARDVAEAERDALQARVGELEAFAAEVSHRIYLLSLKGFGNTELGELAGKARAILACQEEARVKKLAKSAGAEARSQNRPPPYWPKSGVKP